MFFSFIVPVYNTKIIFLKKCIESIRNLKSNDFELLIVDDKSTNPETILFINDLKLGQNEKIFFHKKNSGLGQTRNTGIKNANGKYILFIDSDDWVENIDLDILRKKIIDDDFPDFISLNFKWYYSDKKNWVNKKYYYRLNGKKLYGGSTSWSKVYKKDFIIKNNILFDNSKNAHEDEFFMYLLLLFSPIWKSYNMILLSYNKTDNNSITNSTENLKSLNAMSYYSNKLYSIVKKNNFNSKDFNSYIYNLYTYIIKFSLNNHISSTQFLEHYNNFSIWKDYFKSKSILKKIIKKIIYTNKFNYFFSLILRFLNSE